MALHVVSRLYGMPVAEWTAQRMEYDWHARGQVLMHLEKHRHD